MNDEWKTRSVFLLFIIHHSSFIISSEGHGTTRIEVQPPFRPAQCRQGGPIGAAREPLLPAARDRVVDTHRSPVPKARVRSSLIEGTSLLAGQVHATVVAEDAPGLVAIAFPPRHPLLVPLLARRPERHGHPPFRPRKKTLHGARVLVREA